MRLASTLRIRNLPPDLSNTEKIDLLKHFGALEVKCIGTKNPAAFVRFETDEAASIALKRLHQLDVLGFPLSVDYARSKPQQPCGPDSTKHADLLHNQDEGFEKEEEGSKRYEAFLQRLNAWSLSLDLSQPPPAHLRYQYPPPNVEVLANIARALSAVPKFYTQVLHLMNKMNLPSPFHASCDEHCSAMAQLLGHSRQRRSSAVPPLQEQECPAEEEMQMASSTSESELESDDDTRRPHTPNLPAKRSLPQSKRRVKRPKFVRPLDQSKQTSSQSEKATIPMEHVFEVAERGVQKKIEMRLGPASQEQLESVVEDQQEKLVATSVPEEGELTAEERQAQSELEGFGILFPPVPESVALEEGKKEEEHDGSYISLDQIKANRIPDRDREVLSVFRGYQAGAPTCRLYVKNLSKNVCERDLHFLFRAFLGHKPEDTETNAMFDIRLMREGRMKGQAFVNFPSVRSAQNALKLTNGFILKDKPMVVQFARSAKPRTDPAQ